MAIGAVPQLRCSIVMPRDKSFLLLFFKKEALLLPFFLVFILEIDASALGFPIPVSCGFEAFGAAGFDGAGRGGGWFGGLDRHVFGIWCAGGALGCVLFHDRGQIGTHP